MKFEHLERPFKGMSRSIPPNPQLKHCTKLVQIRIGPITRKVCFILPTLCWNESRINGNRNHVRRGHRESELALSPFPQLPLSAFGKPSIFASEYFQSLIELEKSKSIFLIISKCR